MGAALSLIFIMIEEATDITAKQVVYIMCAFTFLLVVFGPGNALLFNTMGIIYPAYKSGRALTSNNIEQKQRWLIYWCSFAVFTQLDFFVAPVRNVLPFYLIVKLMVLLYLIMPQGSQLFFDRIVQPVLDLVDNFLN